MRIPVSPAPAGACGRERNHPQGPAAAARFRRAEAPAGDGLAGGLVQQVRTARREHDDAITEAAGKPEIMQRDDDAHARLGP